MKNFVEELKWRGMIQDIMPGTEEKLMEGPQAAYVGIDPTADSLHIGHLVSVMILKHFQNCGHKPFALIGGATGMVGDPSMKSAERNLLDEQTLERNVAGIQSQLSRFLDFDSDAPNRAELVNNYDWMKDYTFIGFIRDIGKLAGIDGVATFLDCLDGFFGHLNIALEPLTALMLAGEIMSFDART